MPRMKSSEVIDIRWMVGGARECLLRAFKGLLMNITVDVISDVICPWCLIGKRRLEKAIVALGGKHEVQVHWHPFQLNPNMPSDGVSRKEYRISKFGSWERSQELDARLVAVGQSEGIHFDFDRIKRTPNTVDAHRLIWLADQNGRQDAVMEALFLAYFTQGQDISEREILVDVVVQAGLERERVKTLLDTDEGMEAIREAEGLSRRYRVEGVPFFLIQNEINLSGAQSPETFVAAFQNVIASQ